MSSRAQEAKQRAALGYSVGLDDITAALDWRKAWKDYNAAVKAANEEAASKSGLTSFFRTAVFYAVAIATQGLSIGASAATSYFSGVGAGMVTDELYGDIPVPEKPEYKSRKFKKAQQIEKQTELEGAYDTLASDIATQEATIDTAHWIEPLMNAVAFYGLEAAKAVKDGGFKALFTPRGTITSQLNQPQTAVEYAASTGGGFSDATGTYDASGNLMPGTAPIEVVPETSSSEPVDSSSAITSGGETVSWADWNPLDMLNEVNEGMDNIYSDVVDFAGASGQGPSTLSNIDSPDYLNYADDLFSEFA